MENVLRVILFSCLVTLVCSQNIFNVTNFGALGDGVSDDTQPFMNAWDAVCGAENSSILIIPRNKTYSLNIIQFEGPCKSDVEVQIDGNIVAPDNSTKDWEKNDLKWLSFKDVNGLRVIGDGQINAKGENWWNKTCQENNGCSSRPTTLSFVGCSNFLLKGLTSLNSGKNHISVASCENGTLDSFSLIAPEDSPNTDGIDISESTNITITKSIVATGDDCVAINHGSSQIFIRGMICGPGHGISVGSLGKNGENATVEDIVVKNIIFNGTQNGARIKTWQGGHGYARNITYRNIEMINTGNPIIIDQYYCPHQKCNISDSAVEISDISFINIDGTTPDENAINFSCSESVGCSNVRVHNVNIRSTRENEETRSSCINVHGSSRFSIPEVDCMLN